MSDLKEKNLVSLAGAHRLPNLLWPGKERIHCISANLQTGKRYEAWLF